MEEIRNKLIFIVQTAKKIVETISVDFDQKKEARKNIQEQKSVELSQKWAENREKLPKNKYHSIDFSNKKKF